MGRNCVSKFIKYNAKLLFSMVVFADGGSCACRTREGVWGKSAGSHSGPADLWGLLDGKDSRGDANYTWLL